MVIFLYTNKDAEHQAIACIKSFESKITDDVQVVYYTVGFDSDFMCKNLHKIKIPIKNYPTFHYYKSELSLLTLQLFPNEKYFAFTDSDILFSHRFNFEFLRKESSVPLAPQGPHQYPFVIEYIDGVRYHCDETRLMQYLNVPNQTMWYVWSCFYLFNHNCVDFLEEYTSLCNYQYLLKNRNLYYPFHDETPFNVCMWKRDTTDNLGFCFVNTHRYDTILLCENNNIAEFTGTSHLDSFGRSWEYIQNSEDVMFYHGIKSIDDCNIILHLILNRE